MPDRRCPPAASREDWLQVRRVLGEHRHRLGRVAAGLYPGVARAEATDLLCHPDWIAAEPLPVGAVSLRWDGHAPPPEVTGTGRVSEHVRPVAPGGGRYLGYAGAVAELDRPALLEDRLCYRLLEGTLAAPAGLAFGQTRYFDGVNVGPAVAHELAAAWQRSPGALTLDALPLRAAAGDPCDVRRRPSLCAVTTLTLRRPARGEASFPLHWRDPSKVNHAGGMYQVMPAGIFQPVDASPAALRNDFSLWRCMAREFSEEFLGTPEVYATSGGLLDYERWPFYGRLSDAREAGKLTVWCLGLGTDPLTLANDILTVAVFDADVFDDVFAGLVTANAEGRVVTGDSPAGIPFTAATVTRLTGGGEPMQPAGAALLRLAWRHRRRLLA